MDLEEGPVSLLRDMKHNSIYRTVWVVLGRNLEEGGEGLVVLVDRWPNLLRNLWDLRGLVVVRR